MHLVTVNGRQAARNRKQSGERSRRKWAKAQTWRRLLPRCGNAGHVLPNACHHRAWRRDPAAPR